VEGLALTFPFPKGRNLNFQHNSQPSSPTTTYSMADEAPKKFTLALGGLKLAASKKLGAARPRNAFGDDDEQQDEGPRAQEISHFDDSAGGAVLVDRPSDAPLVIPVPNNRKRLRNGLPAEAKKRYAQSQEAEPEPTAKMHFGLNVIKKKKEDIPAVEAKEEDDQSKKDAAPVKERSLEDAAIQSLLGNTTTNTDFVIPAVTESEAFERDYGTAPDVPTEADYERIPPEQFGAAMLRGMGWKDGEAIGKRRGEKLSKIKPNERRPALLGVGAKPAAALGIEIGTWGKAEQKKKKDETSYNPVIMRNKQTGETLTEEEFKAKLEAQKKKDMELLDEPVHSPKRDPSSSKKYRRNDYDSEDRHRSSKKSSRYDEPDDGYRSSKKSSKYDRDDDHYSSKKSSRYDDDRDDKYRSSKKSPRYDDDRYDRDRRRDRDRDYDDRKGKSRRSRSPRYDTKDQKPDYDSDREYRKRKRHGRSRSGDRHSRRRDDRRSDRREKDRRERRRELES
jgi:G-patch domain